MRYYLLTLFLLFYLSSFGQTEEYLFYLKDGSMYKGVLKTYDFSNKTYEIHIDGEMKIFVNKKAIKRISTLRPNDYFLKNGRSFRTKGYTVGIDYGGGFGKGDTNSSNFNLQIGRYIKPKILLGFGTGIEKFRDNKFYFNYNIIPIYAHFRHFAFQKTISPYYALDVGWGLKLNRNIFNPLGFYRGDILFKPALGLRIASRRNSTFLLEAGYSFQRIYLEYKGYEMNQNTYVDAKGFVVLSRFTFNIGWLF